MKRPALSDHLAAAWISAVAGAAGLCGALAVSSAFVAANGVQGWLFGLLSGLFSSFVVFPIAVVPFGVGTMVLGPIAFGVLTNRSQTGPVAAALGGAGLSWLAALAICAALQAPLIELTLFVAVGGTAAGGVYRRALLAMGAMPRPARPS